MIMCIDETGEDQAVGRIDDNIGARGAQFAALAWIDRCNGIADDGNVGADRMVGVAIVVVNQPA